MAVRLLPSPLCPLLGRCAVMPLRPDNIICFRREFAAGLNNPREGRALHHRYVLILALGAGATVYVDDRTIRLEAGEGLLIFPFQFHDYSHPARENINWLFFTFDLIDAGSQQLLRYRPFRATDSVRRLAAELIEAYLQPAEDDLTSLLLALLLLRVRQAPATRLSSNAAPSPPGLMMQVNHLVQRRNEIRTVHAIAQSLGISESHLRARFRASCGVSVCQHLRRLRLERASGLLRLTTNSVTEISDRCGFSSIYSFSRSFHDAFGVSPRSYRTLGFQIPMHTARDPFRRRSGLGAVKPFHVSRLAGNSNGKV